MTSQTLLCQIADIGMEFYVIETEMLWSTWKWKLDPYLSSVSFVQPDCMIKLGVRESDVHQIEINKLPLMNNVQSGFFQRQIHCTINNDTIWSYVQSKDQKIYLQYQVTSDWKQITLLQDKTNTTGVVAFEYLAQIMPGLFLKHGLLTLHAALVECEGRAFAICAPSGTGKTTYARLWRDYKNALILNGDRAVLGQGEQGWTAYGTPWSGTSGEQINRHAPLTALVILERDSVNSVGQLKGMQAFTSVITHLFYPAWDRSLAEAAIDELNDLTENIPVYRLRCRPDIEAVEVLYQKLYKG